MLVTLVLQQQQQQQQQQQRQQQLVILPLVVRIKKIKNKMNLQQLKLGKNIGKNIKNGGNNMVRVLVLQKSLQNLTREKLVLK
jgi:hypothetical protein